MREKMLGKVLFTFMLNTACGSSSSNDESSGAETADYPSSLLTEFKTWNPLLAGDLAFAAKGGHAGQTTRVYFNDIAAPYFKGEKSFPFAVGSYIAKAVIANANTSTRSATRVYFMVKKESGFDSTLDDWSYAVSNLKGETLAFDSNQGKITLCSGCHSAEKEWDYVKTVDYYRKQSAL